MKIVDKHGYLKTVGLRGPQGTTGIQGNLGIQGIQGLDGAYAAQGIQGTTGIQGAVGAQGYKGPQGVQGITGTQGAVGHQGITGLQGIQGLKGIQGNTGIQGAVGPIGQTGLQGVKGETGDIGIQGYAGPQGIQGIQGVQGQRGTQGVRGIQGLVGCQGIQGIKGIQGTTGIQGSVGTQGTQGLQGLQGVQGYRGVIALTTDGNSGPATFDNEHLNIPDYSENFVNFVPITRELSINGTTYNLTANRSWNVGTVTSIGMTVPTGFTISANPITTSGTFALGLESGYSVPTTIKQIEWSASYDNMIISANVTGTTTKTLTLNQQDGGTIVATWSDYDTAPVTSVFGRLGAIVAESGDYTTTLVTEGSNLYFTTARARGALSFSAGSGAYNSGTGVITIPTNTTHLTNDALFITLNSISAFAPLSYNNTTGQFSISQANGSTDGFLSSTDWTTFNNKQNAGDYITALTGEATALGPGVASVTLNNAAVTGKVLTGVNITGGSISATDSILSAFGKLQNQINSLLGSSIYQGTWNASSNSPSLSNGTGTRGHYYIVNVAGSTSLDGITDWNVGDWAIFDGTAWQQVDNTDLITSVNGQTGAVSLTTDNISEGSLNEYFTQLRARQSISLTTTGNNGAATYNSTSGIINVPIYTLSGLGGTPLSRRLEINGVSYDLSADRSWSVGTVTSVDMTVPTGFTISGNPITGSGTLVLGFNSDYSLPTVADQLDWHTAYNNMIVSASVAGTTTKTLTLTQQDGGTIVTSWSDYDTFPVTSVFGRIGDITAQAGDYTTTLVTEGTNLYYTDARSRNAISSAAAGLTYTPSTGVFSFTSGYSIPTTANQSNWTTAYNRSITGFSVNYGAGTTNLILTQQDSSTINLALIAGAAVQGKFVFFNGSNLAYASLTASAPLSFDQNSFTFSIAQASATSAGYLSAADWIRFNAKQPLINGVGIVYSDGTNISYITDNSSNWNTAYSWGDHALENYATETYVNTAISNLIDNAPTTLDTLNELAAALGDDPNFATTVASSIGTKVPLARNVTINGVTQDLSADRSWTISFTDSYIQSVQLDGTLLRFGGVNSAFHGNIDLSALGYLTSFTETDPTVPSHVKGITTTNISNWNTAFSWGDHGVEGYATQTWVQAQGYLTSETDSQTLSWSASDLQLTISNGNSILLTGLATQSYVNGQGFLTTETDPTVPSHVKAITTTNISNWNSAYSWGNHSTYGYATQTYVNTAIANLVDLAPGTLDTLNELAAALGDDPNFATTVATSIGTKQNQLNGTGFVKVTGTTVSYDNSVYLTTSAAASTYVSLSGAYSNPSWITTLDWSKITNAPAFLTSFTETDPTVPSHVKAITTTNISNWNTAYGWGNHASQGYATQTWVQSQGYLTSVSDVWVNTTGDTMTGSLAFASVADNVRINKSTNFLNLYDPWNNIHLSNNTGSTFIDSSVHYWRNSGGSIYWMTLDSTGLGINTTSPAQKLHVNGNVRFESSNSRLDFSTAYNGLGELPAGVLLSTWGTTNNNLAIIPSAQGTVGSKVVLGAYNGSTWRSLVEFANTAGEPNLLLAKTAGNVGINVSPASNEKLAVNVLDGIWALSAYNNNAQIGGIHVNNSILNIQGSSGIEVRISTTGNATWNGDVLATRPWVQAQGYLTSYSETDTLASVTARGSSTTSSIIVRGITSRKDTAQLTLNRVDTAGADWNFYSWAGGLNIFPNAEIPIYIGRDGSRTDLSLWNGKLLFGTKNAIDGNLDSWLRLNQTGDYSSGVYTPYNLRNDGTFDNYGGIYGYNTIRARKSQTNHNYTTAALWTESYDNTTTGIAFHISGNVGKFLEMRTNGVLYWDNSTVWHQGNLTNLNQLTNGPGYITGYTETDTLATVTARGNSTSGSINVNGYLIVNSGADLVLKASSGSSDPGDIVFENGSGAEMHRLWSGSDSLYYRTNGGPTYSMWHSGNLTNLNQLANGPGYITSYTETDPTVPSHVKTISTTEKSNWNTAYGWGNHASAGYITPSYLDDYTRGSYRVISDYGSHTTWYLRSNGQFIWGSGHDWTSSFRLNLGGYGSNSNWAYFGQQDSNAGLGTWRGVRIRKYDGGSVDGDLSAGAYYIGDTRKDTNWDAAYSWGNHAVQGYATTSYVSTQISNLINGAPGALDTLDELAAALGDDANFASTVTNSIATKLPLAGGIMSGKIFTVSTGTGTYETAIEIRETNYVTTSQSAWGYSPAITFHWGGRHAKRFGMRADGLLAVDDEPIALRSWVTSQGYLTSYSESDTLASVTSRGASTSNLVALTGKVTLGNRSSASFNGNVTGLTLTNTAEIRSLGSENSPALTWHYEGIATRHLLMNSSGEFNFVSPSNENSGVAVVKVNGNTVWHAGNDGSGSGLDADTVDGIDSSRIIYGDGNRGSSRSQSFNDPNQKSGFYFDDGPAGEPYSEWWNWITIAGDLWQSSNNYAFQLAHSFHNDDFYVRRTTNGTPGSWRRVWSTGDFSSTNVSNWNTAYGWGNHSGLYLPLSGGTVSGNINVGGEIAFRDGGGAFSNIIRAATYPSEGYTGSQTFWLEYRAKGGHHFVLNTDGGTGSAENPMDDFIVWQGNIDGDRLLELSNAGNLRIRGTFTELSSRRFKENIKPLEPTLSKVEKLEPVTYTKTLTQQEEIGLIAEDVAELFPEVVTYDQDGTVQGIQYQRLSVILLKAVQELTDRITKLENK